MTKVKYTYNSETCKYEPIIVSPKAAGRKLLFFLGVSLAIGLIGLTYFNSRFPHLDETLQADENQKLKTEWQVLVMQLDRTSEQLSKLELNDDHNYRVILDLEPLDITQREAGVGGHEGGAAGEGDLTRGANRGTARDGAGVAGGRAPLELDIVPERVV